MSWTSLLASRDVHRHRTSNADYLDTCRRKRNVIDYTRSHVATETEAEEILEKVTQFYEVVEAWIDSNFPNLRR